MIRFFWLEGLKSSEINLKLSSQYEGSALSYEIVFLWIEEKSVRTSAMQQVSERRPSTSTTDGNIQQAQKMLLMNKRNTIDEVVCILNINHSSGHKFIHCDLRL
ncbi:hypothetical protein CEXT_373851 [Caerostris extrusa]|uniref:Uncharacterized protein n=1 Tax=Caerostris extrusa TaxID=172846 RepID=A0AAV4MVX0_CAEEX|nr:hypothetical protein CEXT_373851 [Caerostris extrusa]